MYLSGMYVRSVNYAIKAQLRLTYVDLMQVKEIVKEN